jgi:hypothetical protein
MAWLSLMALCSVGFSGMAASGAAGAPQAVTNRRAQRVVTSHCRNCIRKLLVNSSSIVFQRLLITVLALA